MARKVACVLAQFDSAPDLYDASGKVAEAGYTSFDNYSPFPIHGIERKMRIADTPLGWIVFVCGLLGAAAGFGLQSWVATTAYPLSISGKPLFSWQAFVPVTFELTILFSAFGAVFGMFGLNKLPQYYHPVFKGKHFEQVTTDGFFISIFSDDPKFDKELTSQFLEKIGGRNVELIHD